MSVPDMELIAQLEVELDQQLIPNAQRRIAVLRRDHAGDPGGVQALDDVRAGLHTYLALRRGGLYAAAADDSLSEAARTTLARRTDGLMETIITRACRVAAQEKNSAAAVKRGSDATYRSTLVMLVISVAAVLGASDFGGRFGGEEFIILLPDTSVDGGLVVAEKLRASIAARSIIGVDRPITACLGSAGLLDNAGTVTGLLRAIDKAQYAAKAAGRNCCVVAAAEAPAPAAAPASDSAVAVPAS